MAGTARRQAASFTWNLGLRGTVDSARSPPLVLLSHSFGPCCRGFPVGTDAHAFILLVLIAVALASPAEAAPKVKTPYEATIEDDEVYVRSGPGSSKFYPTGKLRRGDKVIVHRHDPGGWFMIAPPHGSFSWIPAKYVRKIDEHQGVITANNVAVRVGSFDSDIRDLFQRTLSENDPVRIINEKLLAPESGSAPAELWYRIEPPRGERRWIPGTAVAPVQAGDRVPREDPFVTPEVDTVSRRGFPACTTSRRGRPPLVRRAIDRCPRP